VNEEAENRSRFTKSRLHIHHFLEGLSYGMLLAPFLVYFTDLKLEFYYNEVGYLLFAYFFLQGIGREYLRRLRSRPALLTVLSAIGNAALVVVGCNPTPIVSTACLLIAFLLWRCGQVQLEEKGGFMNKTLR
jgi:hypothetical protein